jgi:DNA-binding transcriptional MerR regulator
MVISRMRTYSTVEVAKLVRVHPVTLYRWIGRGQVRSSISLPMAGGVYRRWTAADVERVRRFKGTQKPGRKPKKFSRRKDE